MRKIYIIAVVLAICAGLAVVYFASSLKNESADAGTEPTSAVVAVVNIPVNTVVTLDMVTTVMIPAEAVHPQTYRKIEDVVGSTTLYPIAPAEQVMNSRVSESGEDTDNLSLKLSEGQRAISIEVSTVTGVSGNIAPGDYVDIMAMMMVPDATGETVYPASTFITQHIQVLSIGTKTTNGQSDSPNYTTVTLAGTPEQILQIYYAANMGYSASGPKIALVMRPATDDGTLVLPYYRPKY